GPRAAIDREPRRDRDGSRRHSREGRDVPMKVGLVRVSALRRHEGGAVTRGEAVRGVIEADELCRAFGREPDLGPEAGPKALATPADPSRNVLDANLPVAGQDLVPREGDLWVGRSPRVYPSSERVLCDREPVVPRRGRP